MQLKKMFSTLAQWLRPASQPAPVLQAAYPPARALSVLNGTPSRTDYLSSIDIIANDLGLKPQDLKALPEADGTLVLRCVDEASPLSVIGLGSVGGETWREATARAETLHILERMGVTPNTTSRVIDSYESYMLAHPHLYMNASRKSQGPQ